MSDEAGAVIAALGLEPHPEGGAYREIYRDPPNDGGHGERSGGARGAVTSIYYLLRAGERSHWHRVDAAEVWAYHAGAPLELLISDDGRPPVRHVLGADLATGKRPQAIVPAHAWQSAASLGAWTLVGCVVAPAFSFEGFELAPPGWTPGEPV